VGHQNFWWFSPTCRRVGIRWLQTPWDTSFCPTSCGKRHGTAADQRCPEADFPLTSQDIIGSVSLRCSIHAKKCRTLSMLLISHFESCAVYTVSVPAAVVFSFLGNWSSAAHRHDTLNSDTSFFALQGPCWIPKNRSVCRKQQSVDVGLDFWTHVSEWC
jgi:hypothetical protein